jgi:hypothetical protein
VHRVGIDGGVDGNRFNTHFSTCPMDTQGNFTAVGN